MRGSDFILDSVQMMYYKCHNVNFKWGGLHIDSQDWIKKKKKCPEICPAYISKINSNCEKQIILLIIPNKEKGRWRYLAVKILYYLYY